MLTHSRAKALVDELPGVNAVESLFLRGVSDHETGYGGGWKPEKVKQWYGKPIAWRPGVTAPWNMGAITTLHPNELSFSHQDSQFDPKEGHVVQYVTWFAGDPTPELGFARLRDTALKPNVRAALENNDFMLGIIGMYENGYFRGLHTHELVTGDRDNIKDYYAKVAQCIVSIGQATGEVQPDVLSPKAAR